MVTYAHAPTALPPLYNEGLSLAAAGFDTSAICIATADRPVPSEALAPGFTVAHIRIRSREAFHAIFGIGTPVLVLAALQYALSYLEYVAKAFSVAARSGADLFQAHDLPALPPALLAATLKRRPCVYRAHEMWSEAQPKVRFASVWRWLERALVPRCDEVVTPDEDRSRILQEEFGARRLPMTVRNCPPHRPRVESTRLRDELARRGVRFSTIVLYQGLVDSMRCIEEIAEATRSFEDGVVLVILGSGFGEWARPAERLAGYERVVVLPKVSYEAVAEYTASADIGILLYRNDCRNNYHCAPNKIFEYMMMGLPVVAPAFPGMVRLVEQEDVGICVDPERPEAIAAAVNRLSSDRDSRARMRANAIRLTRERYNWEIEFRPLLQRYRGLLDAR